MMPSMSHLLAPAPSGRSKCRGCGQPIAQGAPRFGESLPNAFGAGEMTLWFHPLCAAYKLPDAVLEALQDASESVVDLETLRRAALECKEHPRLARMGRAEHSRSGQAACRHCHEPIAKGIWRIRIVYFEEGRFAPGGYIHLACSKAYFETPDVLEPALQLSAPLSEAERQELTVCLGGG